MPCRRNKSGVTPRLLCIALALNALIEFQKKAGITPAIGYFGSKTRAYVDNLIGQGVAP